MRLPQIREELLVLYPRLAHAGGFELLLLDASSKQLIDFGVRSSMTAKELKDICARGRIYIRPIQQSLSLEEADDEVSCVMCTD
jgi:hypothetical protein